MKHEIRNTKYETNSNHEIRNQKQDYSVLNFKFNISCLFRISYFGFRASKKGFTLVEVLVGAAVFLIIALAAYNAYIGLFNLISLSQNKVLAVSLANEQFEIARNMPYSSVGITGGIPNGSIPHVQTINRGAIPFTVTTTVRNIDLPFDGLLCPNNDPPACTGSPKDLSPSDNKSFEVTVSCDSCKNMKPVRLAGQIAPKNLETASTNGALFVRVFDANGQPVKDAAVHVVNIATTTTIVIDDITDANGMLQLVDVPPGTNAYRVTVTKSGYSSDRTYPPGGSGNPTPAKPDATVLVQNVTSISFAIDQLGSLAVSSVTPLCVAIPSFNFDLKGSKLLNASGTAVPKYSQSLVTNGSGTLSLPSMEWDTYTVTPNESSYDVAGLNPLNPVTINPGAAQQLQIIAVPSDVKSLLVTVKDNSTLLPITDATVVLTKSGYSETLITGKGYISQSDWSGGLGQATSSNETKYWNDDGFVDVTTSSGEIRLKNVFGSYNPSGVLESSTFDTGTASNFNSLVWSPSDAPASTTVKFQIATATTSSPTSWNFLGPDGTSGTYYTVSDTPIAAIHDGDQFLRYKVFLATEDPLKTPSVSDVSFTFTTSCTPPGQVIFSGLSSGTYHVKITKTGYAQYDQDVSVSANWQEVQAVMAP